MLHHCSSLVCLLSCLRPDCCLVKPEAGFLLALGLTLAYAFEMRHLGPAESCRCFGSLGRTKSRWAAVRRNILLAGVSAVGFLGLCSVHLDGSIGP